MAVGQGSQPFGACLGILDEERGLAIIGLRELLASGVIDLEGRWRLVMRSDGAVFVEWRKYQVVDLIVELSRKITDSVQTRLHGLQNVSRVAEVPSKGVRKMIELLRNEEDGEVYDPK